MIDLNDYPQTVYQYFMGSQRSDLTRQAYACDLKSFAKFIGVNDLSCFTKKSPIWDKLTPSCIFDYAEWLKSTTSKKTGNPYASSTIARKITVIKDFLATAKTLGCYKAEWLELIKVQVERPEVVHQHQDTIAPNDQKLLLQVASKQSDLKEQRDYLIFRLLLETGIRRSELCKLKVRDLSIKETIPMLFIKGKGGHNWQARIEGDTYHLLKEWLSDSGQGAAPDRPIFSQVRKFGRRDEARYRLVTPDKPLSTRAINLLVEQYCKLAGIESKVTPHSFRVAMVTDMLDGGAPIQHVQKVTGHTTTRMITEVYDRNQYREPVSKFRKHQLFKPGE